LPPLLLLALVPYQVLGKLLRKHTQYIAIQLQIICHTGSKDQTNDIISAHKGGGWCQAQIMIANLIYRAIA
jgi:hypothetical protein